MKPTSRSNSKGRGQSHLGTLKKLRTPQLKKTTKFKSKVAKKECVSGLGSRRSTGNKALKRPSSSPGSEPVSKASSSVSRGRTTKASSKSPGRANHTSPVGNTSGKSPPRKSPGRSPVGHPSDGVKGSGKSSKAHLTDPDSATEAKNSKSKSPTSERQEMKRVGRDAPAEGSKSTQSAKSQSSSEKGKKASLLTSKTKRNSECKCDSSVKSGEGVDDVEKDKKKGKKAKENGVEKDDTDKFNKKKKKVCDGKEDNDKELKKNKKLEDSREEGDKEPKKSKKLVEEIESDEEEKNLRKVTEENELIGKEAKKGRKLSEESDTVSKRKAKKSDQVSENDKEKKKNKKLTEGKEEVDKIDKKQKKVVDDSKESEGDEDSEDKDSESSSSAKVPVTHSKSSKEKVEKVSLKSETKESSSESGSMALLKPKKGAGKKLFGDNDGECSGKLSVKDDNSKSCANKNLPPVKKENVGDAKVSKEKDTKQLAVNNQDSPAPKKRGRPKGSKNKKKNEGFTTKTKKDKNKAEKKVAVKQSPNKNNNKKERSVFSFSESEGEKEEKYLSNNKRKLLKSSNNLKSMKPSTDNESISSSENLSSDEDTKEAIKCEKEKLGNKKGRSMGNEKAKQLSKKSVIGSKSLKKGSMKTNSSLCKKVLKQAHRRGSKKQSRDVSYSSDDTDDKKVSTIPLVRSDYSYSSDNEDPKNIQKSASPKRVLQFKEEETSEEDASDDADWQVGKNTHRKLKHTKRGRPAEKTIKKKPVKAKINYRSDDDDDDDEDNDEDEDDEDYEDYKGSKSRKGKTFNKKDRGRGSVAASKKGKVSSKKVLKSESSSEVDEECDSSDKKPRKKVFKSQKSSKDEHKADKKTKKVSFGKKGLSERDDSSEVDESGKESDSEYEDTVRKKKTVKGTLKSNKHLKTAKKREEMTPPPQRTVRIASLNARAMMHCMNEDARIPLPTLPPAPPKNDNVALFLRDSIHHHSHSEDSDEERDYDTDDDRANKRSKMNKRKNEEESEKKVKQKRKRRRGELDVHMDMRDMVVTKRMASLNASAIMAASYSNERKRTPATGTSSSAESEITNVDIQRKISVTKGRSTTTRSVITVEETTKKVKKAQGNHETQMEEHIIVKKKVRKSGTVSDKEDGTGTDDSQLDPDMMPKSPKDPVSSVVDSTLNYSPQTPPASMTVTISGESTYCISSSDGKTTTVVKQVQRKSTTTVCPTTSVPPTACIPPTHHVQPQPHTSYPASSQKQANYTPLGALSTMQPVMSSSSHHHHHHYQHPQPHPPPHHHQPPPHHQPHHHHQPPPPHHQAPPHHQPSHHQPPPPPHHQPPLPHHHPPPPPPHHQAPPHHPPPQHPPPHPHSHPHHQHHQPYPPAASHPHGGTPPHSHHYGYRPPSQPSAGHQTQGNPPPPSSSHSHPGHTSPGYMSPPNQAVVPNHPSAPPHHSPKQITSPNIVSPSIKSPTGSTGTPTNTHPPGSPRGPPPPPGQIERHHSAFTAPTPSVHSPAASTPAGYQPVSGPMPVKANYTATTSDASIPYKAPPKGSPVAAAPPYSSPPRLTSPPPPVKGSPYQPGAEPYPPSYQYQTYSYHPAPPPPPPPPPIAPYDKYYPRGATYHLYPPSYTGGQYAAPGTEYSYPPPPPGSVHYSQESYTYTLCVPNSPPQGPPQALALPPPPPPTSNAPHPPAYATYHYMDYTPVFTYPPPGTIVKINFIGPSSQSTICCPVDPKNVHTGPPTGSGRGPETPANSMGQCSGATGQSGGGNYHYQYPPTQQQPPHQQHSGTQQGCSTTPVYQTGPLTTVMTTGTQPTIQVYGAVVPQQALTFVPSQDTQAATAPPPIAPPPVPAPVPPNVPLSHPQPATTASATTATTMVAIAPISVTVPMGPGTQVGAPQSAVSSDKQLTVTSEKPNVSVSEVPPTTAMVSHSATAYVTGVSQAKLVSMQPPSPGRPQPVTAPTHVTSTVMSGRFSVTAPTQVTSSVLPGRPQQAVAPTQVTTAIVTGMPHTTIASSHVPTSSVTVTPRSNLGTTKDKSIFTASISQPSPSSNISVSSGKSLDVPKEPVAKGTSGVTQITTAVVTGVPKCSSSIHVSTTLADSETKLTSLVGMHVTREQESMVHAKNNDIIDIVDSPTDCTLTKVCTESITSQPEVIVDTSRYNTSSVGTNSSVSVVPKLPGASVQTTAVVSGVPKPPKSSSQLAVVSGIPKASSKVCGSTESGPSSSLPYSVQSGIVSNCSLSESMKVSHSVSSISNESLSSLSTKFTTAVVSDVPRPTKASNQAITAVVSCLPKSPKVCTQLATAIVSGVPKQPHDIPLSSTAVSVVPPSFKSSQDTSLGIQALSSPHKASPQVTTAVVCGVPKSFSAVEQVCSGVTGLPSKSPRLPPATTAIVSGVQKLNTPSLPVHTVSEVAKSPFPQTSVNACGVNKLASSQSNTAIVSGVPRVSVAPTHITKMKPEVSKSVTENTSSVGNSGATNTTQAANLIRPQVPYVSKEGPSPLQTSFKKDNVMQLPSQENKTMAVSPVISTVPDSHANVSNSVKIIKEGSKTTCSVSPMNVSEGLKVSPVLKSNRESTLNIPSNVIETPKPISSISRLPTADLKIPEPTANWSPKGIDSARKSDPYCASNILTQTTVSTAPVSDSTHTTSCLSLKSSSHVVASSSVVNCSANQVNHNLSNPSATNAASLSTSVSTADTKSIMGESGKTLGCSKVQQNTTKEGGNSVSSDSHSSGYQRPSTRHLLCQSLPRPTLTKTATASLAKPKASSNSNIQRMLVKSEDKPKDIKPNIPEDVPNSNLSNSNSCGSFSTIMPLKVSTKKEIDTELEDVKTDIINTVPVGRKRGRPPKVRDSSSDSNTASDSSAYHNPNKVKPKLSATLEKKPFTKEESDVKRSKLSDTNLQSGKTLRSQSEDKKLKLQCPKTPNSPSKSIDSKQDIKLTSAIKTEDIPKIKVEKVSPKGVAKHSPPLKDASKEMFFKSKFLNGQDLPLTSPFLSKKCDLSVPGKTMGFNSLKDTKSSKEIRKSSPVLNDQRMSKNNVITPKSKPKEADTKFFMSSNTLKRKNSDTLGADEAKNASSSMAKPNPSEGSSSSSRSSVGVKQQTLKSQRKEKVSKGGSHRSSPNGKMNRKKSLLSYLKEKNNESDTSSVDSEAASGSRRRSRSKEDSPKANSASSFPPFPPQPINQGSRRRSAAAQGKSKAPKKPKWVNNWSWEGEPFEGKIWLRNDELPLVRTCYTAIRHKEGDIVRVRDCVLLRSGTRKTDLPFVAKIASLWEDPETSDMKMSILWYYRPEHTDSGRRPEDLQDEVFASKHRDHVSVACIEDRCFVLTFNEYCRYRRFLRLFQEGVCPVTTPVPGPEEGYCRKDRQPPGCVVPELLFFCRRVYDYRQKRLLKNPY